MRIASGCMMNTTSKEEMIEDIRWLLSIVSIITEYHVDYERIRKLKEKYG